MSALRGKADLNQAMTPASPYDPDPRGSGLTAIGSWSFGVRSDIGSCHQRPLTATVASDRSGSQTPDCPLGPAEARENGAAHDPIFVLLRQERQLLGEMGNALLVGGLDEAIGDIGPPIATLRTVCVKQPADVGGEITKRISFG